MSNSDKPRKGSCARKLMDGNFSGLTVEEIAARLHTSRRVINRTLRALWKQYGYIVPGVKDYPPLDDVKINYGQVVHGKCKECAWYWWAGPSCDFNAEQYPSGMKHGPIDKAEGGCDQFKPGTREHDWMDSRWLWRKEVPPRDR